MPLLGVDECADEIVDAILYERGETFIPSVNLLGVLKMWRGYERNIQIVCLFATDYVERMAVD
jgi:hypothetical protein